MADSSPSTRVDTQQMPEQDHFLPGHSMTHVQLAIIAEIATALARTDAPHELRDLVEAWQNSRTDDEVLELLRAFNKYDADRRHQPRDERTSP